MGYFKKKNNHTRENSDKMSLDICFMTLFIIYKNRAIVTEKYCYEVSSLKPTV